MTLQVWTAALAVFAVLIAPDLVLTKGAEGLRAAAVLSGLWIATAVAGSIWAVYSFFLGRLGGRAFEDRPWAGFAVAFGVRIAVSGLVEVIRRIGRSRERSGRPR